MRGREKFQEAHLSPNTVLSQHPTEGAQEQFEQSDLVTIENLKELVQERAKGSDGDSKKNRFDPAP